MEDEQLADGTCEVSKESSQVRVLVKELQQNGGNTGERKRERCGEIWRKEDKVDILVQLEMEMHDFKRCRRERKGNGSKQNKG
eukprot:753023-Hanusia_phi.AAC.9